MLRGLLSGAASGSPGGAAGAAAAGSPSPPRRLTFEITVDRWDEIAKRWSAKKHISYKATVQQVELGPSDGPCANYAQLERLLVPPPRPHTMIKKAQLARNQDSNNSGSNGSNSNSNSNSNSSSSSAGSDALFSRSKVGHFENFRDFKKKLYALHTRIMKAGESDGGRDDDAQSVMSGASDGSQAPDLPSALDGILPQFPPTLMKRMMGLSLSENEHRTRVLMLEDWLRAVVLAMPALPRACQRLIASFLELSHLGEAELGAALPAAAANVGVVAVASTSEAGPEAALGKSPEDALVMKRIREKADLLLREGHIDAVEHAMMLHPIDPSIPPPSPPRPKPSAAAAPPPTAPPLVPSLPSLPTPTPSSFSSSSSSVSAKSTASAPAAVKVSTSARLLGRLGQLAGAARRSKAGAEPPLLTFSIPEHGLGLDPGKGGGGGSYDEEDEDDYENDARTVTSGVSELSLASDLRGLLHSGVKQSLRARPKRWLDDTEERPLRLHGGGCGPLPVVARVFRADMVAKRAGGSRRHVGYRVVLRLHGAYFHDYRGGEDEDMDEEGDETERDEEDGDAGSRGEESSEYAGLREIEVSRTASFEVFRQLHERLAALGVSVAGPAATTGTAASEAAVFPKSQSALDALQGGLSEVKLRERCRQLHNWWLCLLHALPSFAPPAHDAVMDWLGLDIQDPRVALSRSRRVLHFAILGRPVPQSCMQHLAPLAQHLLASPLDPAVDILGQESVALGVTVIGPETETGAVAESQAEADAKAAVKQNRAHREASLGRLTADDMATWSVYAAWSHLTVSVSLAPSPSPSLSPSPQTSTSTSTTPTPALTAAVQSPQSLAQAKDALALTISLACGPRPRDWEYSDARFVGYDSPRFSLPLPGQSAAAVEQTSLPSFQVTRSLRELCDLRTALEELAAALPCSRSSSAVAPLAAKDEQVLGATVPGMHHNPFPNISCLLQGGGSAGGKAEAELCLAELSRWIGAIVRNTFRLSPEMQHFVESFLFGEAVGDPRQRGPSTYYHNLMRQVGGSWILPCPRAVNAAATLRSVEEQADSKKREQLAAETSAQRMSAKNACCVLM